MPVTTLKGRILLTIPAGTQTGKTIRLTGQTADTSVATTYMPGGPFTVTAGGETTGLSFAAPAGSVNRPADLESLAWAARIFSSDTVTT